MDWLKGIGLAGFLFFLLKGIGWLIVFYLISKGVIRRERVEELKERMKFWKRPDVGS